MCGRFNDKGITKQYIGAVCAEYRRFRTPYTQNDVAEEVGCDRSEVSKFERGIRSNAVIFLWYIKHGIFDEIPVNKWNGWNL